MHFLNSLLSYYQQLGPLSYVIVVNHNGFVVKHPLLKTQELWDIEPPSIDILDVEVVKNDDVLDEINWVSFQLKNSCYKHCLWFL